MAVDLERKLQRWKLVAALAFVVAGLALASSWLSIYQSDQRLIGIWQSDADRTIAGIRELKPVDENQEAAFRRLFGKMRVSYSRFTCTGELDGVTTSVSYQVLGRDEHSVVIREIDQQPSLLDEIADLSEFAIIHFDGPDSYWVYSEIGNLREYFRRVR